MKGFGEATFRRLQGGVTARFLRWRDELPLYRRLALL
jgi:hypothetical protein